MSIAAPIGFNLTAFSLSHSPSYSYSFPASASGLVRFAQRRSELRPHRPEEAGAAQDQLDVVVRQELGGRVVAHEAHPRSPSFAGDVLVASSVFVPGE